MKSPFAVLGGCIGGGGKVDGKDGRPCGVGGCI